MKLTKLNVAAGLLTMLAVAGGSAAYAIPNAGGVVHACYNKNSGALRVTDPATNKPKACTKSENALNWGGAGAALSANVTDGGVLEGGTALSVEHPYKGLYKITFDRDVSDCAPTASVRSTKGGIAANLAVAMVGTGTYGPNVISVYFHQPDPAKQLYAVYADTDFHLVVNC